MDRIKSGKAEKDVPIYVNFQLTRRRSSILYHLRNLKREGRISKFYSDESGSISLRVKDGVPKIKLTNFPTNKNVPGSPLRTVMDREEIVEIAGIQDGGSWA